MEFTLSGGTLNIGFDFLMEYDTLSISALTENGIIYSQETNSGLTYNQGSFYRYSKDNRVYLCTANYSGSSVNLSQEINYFKRSSVLESLCYGNNIQIQLFNKTDNLIYETYDLLKINLLNNYLFSISTNSAIRLTSNDYTNELINEFVYSLSNQNMSQYDNNWFFSPWNRFDITINSDNINDYSGKTFEVRVIVNNFKCLPNILLDNISINEDVDLTIKELNNHSSNIGFELTKVVDNVKSHVNQNKLILNSKELELNLDINYVIEKNILTYILDNRIEFNQLIDINLTFIDENDLLSYLKLNFVNLYNRKTVKNYYFIGELYRIYCDNVLNHVISHYNFEQLNAYVKKINTKWQNFIEQLLPATAIISSLNSLNNNLFFQNNKFQYKKYNVNYYSGNTVTANVTDLGNITSNSLSSFEKTEIKSYSGIKTNNFNYGSEFISYNITI